MISDAAFKEWLNKNNVQRVMLMEANYFDPALPVGTTPAYEFSRNSTALKQDWSVVAANKPRYEDGLFNTSVMVESGTTNLFKYSQEFNNAWWAKTRSSITADATTAPDGTATADKLVANAEVELAHHTNQSVSVTAGTTYTFSIFAKAGEYGYMALQFLANNGAYAGSLAYFDLLAGTFTNSSCNNAGMEDVGGGWYRCWVSETAIATVAGLHSIMLCQNYADVSFTGDGTSGIFIWGAQLEAIPYLTSYMPTTSATVTRNHDNLSIPSSLLNTESGTVECWAQARRRDDLDYQTVFAAWPFFYVSVLVGTSQARLHIQDGAGVSRNFTSVASVNTAQWNHFAVTWNSEQMWLYVNGVLACTTGVNTFQPPPAVLQLGARSSMMYLWNGLIDSVRVSNIKRSPAELYQNAQGGNPMEWDSATTALYTFDVAQERTVYLADKPYVSGPADSPANQPYEDSILDTPKFSSSLSDAMEGYTVPSWGDAVISNALFDKDIWFTYSWNGRGVRLLFGDPAWPLSDFRSILVGTISGIAAASSNQIKMAIKDKQWDLNKPIQSKLIGEPVLISGTTYKVSESAVDSIDEIWDMDRLLDPSEYTTDPTGTPATFTLDVGPVGILSVSYTGGPASTGQPVPLAGGEVFNVTPVLLSAPLLKYQINDGPIKSIVQVRDGGVPIVHTDTLNDGTFILGSKPVGAVTCDFLGATSDGVLVEGVGRLIRWYILNQTDLTTADINMDSLSAFVNLCTQRVQMYVNSRRNVLDVLDELIRSVGSFYTPDRNGKMIFGRIDNPSGTPVLEITADDIVAGSLKIAKQSVPWQTARVAYGRNYTPQTSTHGALTDSEKAQYAQAWKYAKRTNPNIKTSHLLAAEPDAKQTALVDAAEAYIEADRLLALNGVVRTTYTAECLILPLILNLGNLVKITHPRYGLANGKLVYVVGIKESIVNRRITLTLWG